ncbi:hypothetical protein BDV10DRAFT_187046 [Aspergillus recurvatus]
MVRKVFNLNVRHHAQYQVTAADHYHLHIYLGTVKFCVEQDIGEVDKRTITENGDNFILDKDGRVTDVVSETDLVIQVSSKVDIDLDNEFVIVRTKLEAYTPPIHGQIKAIENVNYGIVIATLRNPTAKGSPSSAPYWPLTMSLIPTTSITSC